MTTERKATTMSVSEMQKMLGLKKTDAYWMTHQGYFKVILVNGKMRIDIESFEDWYSHQLKRQKVNGQEPGIALRNESYSVLEVANLLQVETDTIYALIHKGVLPAEKIDNHMRIRKNEFESWYTSQNRYRKKEDRDRDRDLEANSMNIPEMGRLIGIDDRRKAYKLAHHLEQELDFVTIADQKRVTTDSFEKWYVKQTEYRKLDVIPNSSNGKRTKITSKTRVTDIDPNKVLYTTEETAILLDLTPIHVRCLILSGEMPAKKFGGKWRIHRDDIRWWIHQQEMNNGEES